MPKTRIVENRTTTPGEEGTIKITEREYFTSPGCGRYALGIAATKKLKVKSILVTGVEFPWGRWNWPRLVLYRVPKPRKKTTFKSGKLEHEDA